MTYHSPYYDFRSMKKGCLCKMGNVGVFFGCLGLWCSLSAIVRVRPRRGGWPIDLPLGRCHNACSRVEKAFPGAI